MNQEGKLRLSIIIPMYNVAPYVERCLRSLANQDIPFEDYEIICVNDGSPDNCKEVVENLQSEIPNIVLIDQQNQGVSMARNNAISIARGDYILPIDPDDYLVSNCLKSALDKISLNNLDVLYCAFEIFDVDGVSIWRTNYSKLENRVDNGYDGYFAVRGLRTKDPDRSWAIFYKSSFLSENNILYPKDVPYLEDAVFLGKVFSVVKLVGYSNENFYQRTTRPGSATHSKLSHSDRGQRGFLIALSDLDEFYDTERLHFELRHQLFAKFIFLYLKSDCKNHRLTDYLKKVKDVKYYFNKIRKEFLSPIYLKHYKVFKLSHYIYFVSYRVLR